MSNSQWHDDQSIGERALRAHERLLQAAPELFDTLAAILELYPQINCCCGRAHPRMRESLRERAEAVLGKAKP